MNKDLVKKLIDEAIEENPKLFLVDWSISSDSSIEVLVDDDEGLTVEEIVRISRHIEHHLDREIDDFSLNVSSPGVGNPLLIPRQYKKNRGRNLQIFLVNDEQLNGTLKDANEDTITINWKVREPKKIGKGKQTVEKEKIINYKDIKKALVKITF